MDFAPMRLFICKIASRCNLDCDYCYVYRHADQSWRRQPAFMALDTVAQLGRRINEHAVAHGLMAVDLVLHGGEPFLADLAYLEQLCQTVIRYTPDVEVRFRTQTNGALFDERALAFCQKWQMTVGLSLDGSQVANDRHRLDHKGNSSFAAVKRALTLLASPEGRSLWSGFLTVIDLQNDPLDVYSFLKSYAPRSIEFLLPLAHHEMRPSGKADLTATPYANWLLAIFYAWYHERPQTIMIRRFRDVIALMAGAERSSEEWGLQPVDFAVVETNGEIQAVDTLKVTYPGANHLGLNIFDNSFDDMYTSALVLERQQGWAALCATCQACSLVRICGGGYFPHRYSRRGGFQNPSVYCADLMKLIREIHRTVTDDLQRLQDRALLQTSNCF